MKRADKGLTEIYNRFHSKPNADAEIAILRQLHAEMDRAVLDAYGWTDLQPRLDFILDYEDADNDESDSDNGKKPWRFRWVDKDRDEVLARLLDLNRTRAEEEAQSVPTASATKTAGKRGRKPSKSAPVASPNLFEVQEPAE
jgi:hypothetical protein